MRESRMRSAAVLVGLILVTELLPWVVRQATTESWDSWYASLAKPPWTPPDWAFPVVWPTLYLLMAIAAWLVWRRSGARSRGALTLYAMQLVVNASWTWVFAGLRSLPGGFFFIVGLWLLVIATILAFRRHSGAAAALLLPYLAWVSFAAALNLAIWRLNLV